MRKSLRLPEALFDRCVGHGRRALKRPALLLDAGQIGRHVARCPMPGCRQSMNPLSARSRVRSSEHEGRHDDRRLAHGREAEANPGAWPPRNVRWNPVANTMKHMDRTAVTGAPTFPSDTEPTRHPARFDHAKRGQRPGRLSGRCPLLIAVEPPSCVCPNAKADSACRWRCRCRRCRRAGSGARSRRGQRR